MMIFVNLKDILFKVECLLILEKVVFILMILIFNDCIVKVLLYTYHYFYFKKRHCIHIGKHVNMLRAHLKM